MLATQEPIRLHRYTAGYETTYSSDTTTQKPLVVTIISAALASTSARSQAARTTPLTILSVNTQSVH